MTVGVPKVNTRLRRRVSELPTEKSPPPSPNSTSPELFDEADAIPKKPMVKEACKAPRQVTDVKEKPHGPIRRFVSHEDFDESHSCVTRRIEDFDDCCRARAEAVSDEVPAGSPMLRSSECSHTLVAGTSAVDSQDSECESVPPLPNPLHNARVLAIHTRALRLEAELFPLRLILGRLMANLQHNRRQVFNTPVDPVALGIPDYFSIVKKPMDLGTVKAKLHAVAYPSREEAANDIRLVFKNAMTYNPRQNSIHQSARILLAEFEKAYSDCTGQPLPQEQVVANEVAALPPKIETTVHPSNAVQVPSSVAVVPDEAPCASTNPTSAEICKQPVQVAEKPQQSTVDSAASVAEAGKRHSRSFHKMSQAGYRHVDAERALKRARVNRRRASVPHSCQSCLGRACAVCHQGCLQHEPTLLLCAGPNCHGAKIRKGGVYYISSDGSCHYCHKCHASLPAVLPASDDHSKSNGVVRYKRDLLKRKNDEEIEEEWVTCGTCGEGLHHVCAMHNKAVHDEDTYSCPSCVSSSGQVRENRRMQTRRGARKSRSDMYTFVSGSEIPVQLDEALPTGFRVGEHVLSAETLAHTPISAFMQKKVQEKMVSEECPNAEHTVVVRVISDCNKYFQVPEVVQRHFRMESSSGSGAADAIVPPSAVKYNSKAFALFQKIDGLDVCVFCMYVQEYDGDYEDDEETDRKDFVDQKRVYIAYLDSVEHFRPRPCRTQVYHEMLVSYLASARARGYETAHIWACPPTRGNSFVFWNHPASQRTPTRERLVSWYHGALSRAVDCGIVSDVKSLYERSFEKYLPRGSDVNQSGSEVLRHGRMVCPPLLDGDFWIEEAMRIHAASMTRNLRSATSLRTATSSSMVANKIGPSQSDSKCPALMVASVLQDRIVSHPSAKPFRRPVNAVALKLKDYHTIITHPMDLGTVYSRCLLGEFDSLGDLVADVELVFQNAMRYNPKGHVVHQMAVETRDLFFKELDFLKSCWLTSPDCDVHDRVAFSDLSMSLDMRLCCAESPVAEPPKCKHTKPHENEDAAIAPSSQAPGASASEQAKLLVGGADAIMRRMVGNDVWLLDKRNPVPPKKPSKKSTGKRKKGPATGDEEQAKRRRQSWLGEEVGESVRRLRTSFFTCSLSRKDSATPEEEQKVKEYESYISSFEKGGLEHGKVPSLADTRHALLEVSQFRNFEFDTLRRAKYSTAMLLYHLQNAAPGLVPTCTSCRKTIADVRWHKVKNMTERRQWGRGPGRHAKGVSWSASLPAVGKWEAEELCSECHSKSKTRDSFIPIQVSIQ